MYCHCMQWCQEINISRFRILADLFYSQNELSGVGLAGGSDKVDNLVVGVSRYVSSVDQYHLISFVQLWITPVKMKI